MRLRKRHAESGSIETVIGKNATFHGELSGEGLIRIDGRFQGIVQASGDIEIGPEAHVTADLVGRHITIAGTVHGNVAAHGRLELLATARLKGEIRAQRLVVEEGALFDGSCETEERADEGGRAAVGRSAPAQG